MTFTYTTGHIRSEEMKTSRYQHSFITPLFLTKPATQGIPAYFSKINVKTSTIPTLKRKGKKERERELKQLVIYRK